MKETIKTILEHPFASAVIFGIITHGLAEMIHGPRMTRPTINMTSTRKTES